MTTGPYIGYYNNEITAIDTTWMKQMSLSCKLGQALNHSHGELELVNNAEVHYITALRSRVDCSLFFSAFGYSELLLPFIAPYIFYVILWQLVPRMQQLQI